MPVIQPYVPLSGLPMSIGLSSYQQELLKVLLRSTGQVLEYDPPSEGFILWQWLVMALCILDTILISYPAGLSMSTRGTRNVFPLMSSVPTDSPIASRHLAVSARSSSRGCKTPSSLRQSISRARLVWALASTWRSVLQIAVGI